LTVKFEGAGASGHALKSQVETPTTMGIMRSMQTLVFNFKTKTVGVVGAPAIQRSYADILAAQQKMVANSPATASQPQISRP
jgi:hypothetical protein